MNDNAKEKKSWFSRSKKPPAPKSRPVVAPPRWNSWQGWVNIVLVFITLEVAVLSVEQAHWISPQPSLTLTLIIAVVLTVLMVRTRLFTFVQVIIIVIVGLLVTLWQTVNCLAVSETPPMTHLASIFQTYLQGSNTLLPGDEKIVYVVFITFVTWLIGYLATWFIVRRNNAWVTVVLGTVVLLFNLSNLPDTYYFYFIPYFFAAAMLVSVTRMSAQPTGIIPNANYDMGSLFYLGVSLLCITVLAASLAWITPQARATGLQEYLATSMPWQNDLMGSRVNIFNVVPSKQSVYAANNYKEINFGESWNQGDEVKFVIISERPAYWRMNVYDTYSSTGWTSNPTNKRLQTPGVSYTSNETALSQQRTRYAVLNNISSDIVFNNGDFMTADIPIWLNLDASRGITSLTATRILDIADRYTMTTWVSTATESELANAKDDYPAPISDTYLQLPDDFPEEIRQLAETITANSTTSFTKVKAVISYLKQFRYSLSVQPAPEGADNVEYFLFTRKTGFCLHFASAATVMLRSAGVPARMAIGYLPGDPGATAGQYILRDRYFHAWTQVYFPEYGWIDVEATPGGLSSPVKISSPWVSSDTIKQESQWDIWGDAVPPQIQNIANFDLSLFQGGVGEKTSSSFPAGLTRILFSVFGAIIVIGLLVVAIIFFRSLSYHWLWRVNRETLIYDTYLNMCRLAATVGLVPQPAQTPLEYTTELTAALPEQAKEVNLISQMYMDSRFGGRDAKPGMSDEAELLKARYAVYHQLLQRLSKFKRLFVTGKG